MSRSISRRGNPCARTAARTRLPSPLDVLRGAFRTLSLWTLRWQDRRHLRELDERMLRDVGLSREDVEREAGKPFWRA